MGLHSNALTSLEIWITDDVANESERGVIIEKRLSIVIVNTVSKETKINPETIYFGKLYSFVLTPDISSLNI